MMTCTASLEDHPSTWRRAARVSTGSEAVRRVRISPWGQWAVRWAAFLRVFWFFPDTEPSASALTLGLAQVGGWGLCSLGEWSVEGTPAAVAVET